MRQATGLVRSAIGAGANPRFSALPDAEGKQLLRLLAFSPAQFFDGEGGQGDRARLFRLGRLEPQTPLCLLKALDHAHSGPFQVDVPPT